MPRRRHEPRVLFITGCRDCGLLFSNPLPTPEQLARIYSQGGEWAAMRVERTARLEAGQRRRLAGGTAKTARLGPRREMLFAAMQPYVPVLSPFPGARALDVGCGDGKLLTALQNLGWETSGIEPSSNLAFHRHHRLDSPPQDASFDLVVLHHVLEHVSEPLALLGQLAGTLREGGALFVSVPRLDTLPEHRDFHYCLNGRTHLLAFSEVCLRGLLARAGFATAASLHAPELDQVLTAGQPLRLRVVATRTRNAPQPPRDPLRPAVATLARYFRTGRRPIDRWRSLLPTRLRGALVERMRA